MLHLLFLDVDGVLNAHEKHRNGYGGIRKDCADTLNLFLDACPDVQIVLISSWRYPAKYDSEVIEFILLQGGVNCWGRIHGSTCSDESICPRIFQPPFSDREAWTREGIKWRSAQVVAYVALCSPDRFAVLDDLDLDAPNLFQTNGSVGVSMVEAQALISFFQERCVA